MRSISAEEFLFWKKKQLSKGGDQQSFAVLLDCLGGLTARDLNLININSCKYINTDQFYILQVFRWHIYCSYR